MPVNFSSRISKISIGGVDFTPCLISLVLQDPARDRGLLPLTGTLTLASTPGRPESLDNLDNPRFFRGQQVIVETRNSSGTFERHPRGALRILSATYNAPTLTLDVGCLLALLNRPQATEQKLLQTTLGTSSSFSGLIARCLGLAGVPVVTFEDVPSGSTEAPLNPGSSYLATASDLLYSAGCYAWCDRNEVVRVRQVRPEPEAAEYELLIGTDCIEPVRNRDPELPPERLRATGQCPVVVESATDWESRNTKFANARLLDSNSSGVAVAREVRQQEQLEFEPGRRISTQEERLAQALVFQGLNFVGGANLISNARTLVSTDSYEDERGRLIRQVQEETGILALAVADWLNWHLQNQTEYSEAALVDSFTVQINGEDTTFYRPKSVLLGGGHTISRVEKSFEYDSQDQLIRTVTQTYLTRSAILGGTAIDWEAYQAAFSPDIPGGLELATEETEEYLSVRAGQWKLRRTVERCAGLSNPQSFDAIESVVRLVELALAFGDAEVEENNSTSGQLQPPAAERAPGRYTQESTELAAAHRFPQRGGTYQERELPLDCPMLPSGTGTDNPGVRVYGGTRIGAISAQVGDARTFLANFARVEGALRWARHTGSRIDFRLNDYLLANYSPLMTVDVAHPNGRTDRFGLDAVSWVLTQTECRQSADGLLWGRVQAGGVLRTPYAQASVSYGGVRVGGRCEAVPYALQSEVLSRGGVKVGGSAESATVLVARGGVRVGGRAEAAGPPLTLDPVLLAYWAMNEASGQRNDSHTDGRHLTESGAVGSSTTAINGGRSASFTGSGIFYLQNADPVFNIPSDNFYVALWAQTTTTTAGTRVMVARGEGITGGDGAWYLANVGATLNFTYKGLSLNWQASASVASAFAANAWRFVELVIDFSNGRIGLAVQRNAFTWSNFLSGFAGFDPNTASPLSIGSMQFSSRWSGLIDEVAFYKGLPTEELRDTLWNGGAGRGYAP